MKCTANSVDTEKNSVDTVEKERNKFNDFSEMEKIVFLKPRK